MGALAVAALALAGCVDAPASGEEPSTVSPTSAPIAETPSPTPTPTSSPRVQGTVVTIGDSIMAGYGIDAEDAWPALLERETGASIVNLGCDGAGFVEDGDCGADYAGLLPDAAAEEPALVIIQSSDNDSDDSPATIRRETQTTIQRLHEMMPHAQLVGLSTLWNLPWDAPDTIQASSDALESAVTSVGGRFVSIGQPFEDDPDLLQDDSEHPTAEGQRVLASVIRMALLDAGVRL